MKNKVKRLFKKQKQHNWENKPKDFKYLKTQLNVMKTPTNIHFIFHYLVIILLSII